MAKKRKQTISFLNTYRFGKADKDPIIGTVHDLFEEAGVSIREAHEISGVSSSTFYNWFDGPTRRPQYATVAATLAALGYEINLTAHGHKVKAGVTFDAEAPRVLKRVAPLKKATRAKPTAGYQHPVEATL